MADVSSESSSDESFIGEAQTHYDRIQAYQFEPRKGTDESSSGDMDSTDENSSDADRGVTDGRLLSDVAAWCRCGHCSSEYLRSDEECLCCAERQQTSILAVPGDQQGVCVVNHEDFGVLCLSRVVLRNVLVGLNNVRADNWHVNPPNNRGLRYAAYRQFTWWAHGKLGPGRRRVIPACATHTIKQSFPKTQDEEYRGYSKGHKTDSD